VVAPHNETEKSDRNHRVDHGLVAEDRLAREGGQNFRGQTHRGKDHDVNFGVAEEPEEVLPEEGLSTAGGREEAGAQIKVSEKHGGGGGKNRHGQNQQDRGDEKRPDWQGHAEHGHAGSAHIDDGRDVVCRASDRREAVHEKRNAPEALTDLGAVVGGHGTQRGVAGPSGAGCAAGHEKRCDQNHAREHIKPVAEFVQKREGHVTSADLKRN